MAKQRTRVKRRATFEERLAEEAVRFKDAAEKQPLGSTARKLLLQRARIARELLLLRARQAQTASHINNWLRSPGLQPPEVRENLDSDQKKFDRLAKHLGQLAEDVERAMNPRKPAMSST